VAYTFLRHSEAGRRTATSDQSIDYGELHQRARRVAAHLQAARMVGERALLVYPPGLDFVIAFYGCLAAGVIAVPTRPPHPARLERELPALLGIARNAEARVVLISSSMRSVADGLAARFPDLGSLRWVTTDDLVGGLEERWQRPTLAPTGTAFIQYTSGSTTTPRGVIVSHRSLTHNLSAIKRLFESSARSQGVIWLPPYHDMGLIGGILHPLFCGFPVALMSPVSFLQRPLRWLEAVSRLRGTISGGPNFAYDLCVRSVSPEDCAGLDLSSWDVAFNGAEPIGHATLRRFAEHFAPCGFRFEAFYPCYGLAEATLIVSGGLKASPPVVASVAASTNEGDAVVDEPAGHHVEQVVVGCGRTLLDQEIAIVDPVSCRRCLPEQIGEIWVAGRSVADGYWNRPQETVATFQARLADTGEGPFLRTGDLGFFKGDELFVAGRLKDLIILDGSNHYPQDIEATVESCHPALEPHGSAAFTVVAAGAEHLIVVAEIARSYLGDVPGPPDWERLASTIRSAVSRNHGLRVREVVLVRIRSVPKNGAGKIQRFLCRSAYLSDLLSVLWRERQPVAGESSCRLSTTT
jgi:acyl-CoA synthetase (AMP-forming)/AMP-acid ligase II